MFGGEPILGTIPNQVTKTPIVSKYYELLHQDTFWDVGVEKFGLELTKPSQTSWFSRILKENANGEHEPTHYYHSSDPIVS